MDEADAGLAPRNDFLALAQSLNAEIIDCQSPGHTTPPSLPACAVRLMPRLLKRRWQLDAIYCPDEVLAIIAANCLYPAGWRGRLVFVAHKLNAPKAQLLRPYFNRTDCHAICVSRQQVELMVEAGFRRDRVHHAYNWIDTTFFKPQHDPVQDYVFACGLENRDYSTLIAAFRRLPYKLLIAASGYYGIDRSLQRLASHNVEILNDKVPWTELKRLYAGARFVALPLNPVDYAAGVTGLVEAMAMGKAVVASASAGISEYLGDGDCGRSVIPGNVDELVQAVEELWHDRELCERAGARNRTWVMNASLDNYIEQVRPLMGSPVSNRTPA
jgi:glycosyltransferase involved in cell wall biosynthesis